MTRTMKTNQSGFSLIEVVVALGVVSVTMLAFASFSSLSTDYTSKVRSRNDLFQVKSDILRTVGSQQAWFKMISQAGTDMNNDGTLVNPDLVCVKEGTVCAPGNHELTLLNQEGAVFLDSTKATTGYTREGVPCQSYGQGASGGTCSSQYKVSWSPVCPPAGPCVRPQILVHLSFTTTDTSSSLNSLLGAQIPVDTLIEQSRVQRPLVKRVSTYTNSPVVYTTDAPIEIAPLSMVVGSYNSKIPSFSNLTSQNGGVVQYVSDSKIKYTPRSDFYGTDFFTYPVKDISSGKILKGRVSVRVMTPYTWTGLAGTGDIKSSNQANFCGKVVNGACDATTFPATGWGMGYHLNLVFDSTCTNCNAQLDRIQNYSRPGFPFVAHSLEMTPAFRGNVKLLQDAYFGDAMGPRMIPVNILVQGGTFDATGIAKIDANGIYRQWMSNPPQHQDYALKISGAGRFLAPQQLTIEGAFMAENSQSFTHNNGSVAMGGIWGRNNNNYLQGTTLYDATFVPAENNLVGDFTIAHNAVINPAGPDSRLSNGFDPYTWTVKPPPLISVKGNLTLSGVGGSHCNGFPGGCLGPVFEMNGTGDQLIQGVDPTGWDLDITTVNAKVASAPSIQINKSQGRITMNGVIGIRRDFRVAQIADYDFLNSKLAFNNTDCGDQYFVPGPSPGPNVDYGDVYEIINSCGGHMRMGSVSFNVRGNYYSTSYGSSNFGDSYNSATANLYGNYFTGGYHYHDQRSAAMQVKFVGTGDQTIKRIPYPDGSSPDTAMSDVNILVEKPSGTLFLDGRIATMGDFLVNSGDVVGKPGSVFVNPPHGANWDKTVIRAPAAQFDSIELGHTIKVIGDVNTKNLKVGTTIWGGYGFESGSGTGKFNISGNLELKNTYNNVWVAPNITYVLNGPAAQTVTFSDGGAAKEGFRNSKLIVVKPAGSVSYLGDGKFNKVCVNSAGFSMDPTSNLTVVSKLGAYDSSYFSQNGATVTGPVLLPDLACN